MCSDSAIEEKLHVCELNYNAFTHIFLSFLTDYYYLFYENRRKISDSEKEKFERKLLFSLSLLEKIHYHFFQQTDSFENISYYASTIDAPDDSQEYMKNKIRKQILDLKVQLQQHPFSFESHKRRCLDTLYLLSSYYPKVTIIRDTPPLRPWLSIPPNK